jgi:hypothetical protein
MRRIAGLLSLTFLAACAPAATKPIVPDVVRVQVDHFVPVPAYLVQPVPREARQDDTWGEAQRVAKARGFAIDTCNAHLAAIAGLPLP